MQKVHLKNNMRNSFDQDLNPPKHWLDLKLSTTANVATPKHGLIRYAVLPDLTEKNKQPKKVAYD